MLDSWILSLTHEMMPAGFSMPWIFFFLLAFCTIILSVNLKP